MKINLEITTIVTLITIASFLGGFYYVTQHRLDDVEQKIESLEKKVKFFKRRGIKK